MYKHIEDLIGSYAITKKCSKTCAMPNLILAPDLTKGISDFILYHRIATG